MILGRFTLLEKARLFNSAVVLSLALAILVSTARAPGAAVDPVTLAASKSLEAKMQTLESNDAPSPPAPPVIMTEHEANSYLKVHSGEFLPKGVNNPALGVQPQQATATADVDFDEMSRTYPNSGDMAPKILAAMFHGVQRVTIVAKVEPENGGARVHIESVQVGSMTMPNWLVDYIVQNVLQPQYHFDLSKPLPYPDHVTMVVLGSGQVTCLRGPKVGK